MSSGETRYTIEFAKSGRASCKRCKEKIAKDDMRIGTHAHNGDFELTSWVHPKCFVLPRKLMKSTTPQEFVETMLEDTTDEHDILPQRANEIADLIAQSIAASGKKKKKSSSDNKSPIAAIKRAFEASDGDDASPAAKKAKVDPAAVELFGQYHKLTIDQIKDYLRWNRQVLTGTKDILLFKIIDGERNGRLARCALCGGRLKIHHDDAKEETRVICSGSFDEDTSQRIECAFSSSVEEAPRVQPWYTKTPTEEENAAMDKLADASRGQGGSSGGDGGGGNTSADALAQLTEATANIPWDLSNKAGIKKSVQSLTEAILPTGLLDLPAEVAAAKPKVGAVVSRNRSKPLTGILSCLVEDLGLKTIKEEKAKRKEKAVGSMVKVEANASLVACFQELSELYFKEGNRNAGSSYTKVVNALKNLDFEITSENAPGLYKGKTKIPGIGKGSGEKIVEYLKEGTIAKLEEKRADAS